MGINEPSPQTNHIPTFLPHPMRPLLTSCGCELAIWSNGELSMGSTVDLSLSLAGESPRLGGKEKEGLLQPGHGMVAGGGDAVEIWDARKGCRLVRVNGRRWLNGKIGRQYALLTLR